MREDVYDCLSVLLKGSLDEVFAKKKKLKELHERESETKHEPESQTNPHNDFEGFKINIEPIKEDVYGDYSSNVAMVYAKRFGVSPRELGERLIDALKKHDIFERFNLAGPGFLNWTLNRDFLKRHLKSTINDSFGHSDIGKGKSVNVEYVSANPTGPLHCGHVRGAVIGDVLASLLERVGYRVTREYYINDYGNQINILVNSLYERYLECLGEKEFVAKDGIYPGEYLKSIAEKIVDKYQNTLIDYDENARSKILKDFAISNLMEDIKADLSLLGIKHDVFTSETSLVSANKVTETIDYLRQNGCIYNGYLEQPKGKVIDDWEPNEQTLFRTKQFGDDTDRPLVKSDGSWTYFASDIAYHLNKIERKYDVIIDFFGADHGGYVKRMQAAVSALSKNVEFKVLLCQMVKFKDGENEIKMSKRAGNFITLRDIIDNVGKDIIRFIILTRKSETPMDFDFKAVVDQSKTNPVYYVQYAYARTCSVLKQVLRVFPGFDLSELDSEDCDVNLDHIQTKEEIDLIKMLLEFPRQVKIAATHYEPQKIAFYLYDLASLFHNLWNCGKNNEKLRFVIENDMDITKSKIWLLKCVQKVLKSGFDIIGISPLEEL